MKKILLQVGDHLENVLRVFPLALHLKKYGYEPIILLYKNKCVSRIFINNGIKVIFINDYLKNIKFYTFILEKNLNIRYKGIELKDFYTLEIKKTPFLFEKNKILYRIKKFKQYIDALYKIINNNNPEYIFVWNGYTGNVANGLRLIGREKKIKTFFLERSLWKEGVFIDPEGTNGASNISSLNKIPKIPKKFFLKWEDNENFIKKHIVKKKIIFIPFQVEDDTNIHLYSNEIKKMKDFVKIVVDNIDRNFLIVARPHPEENKSITYKFDKENILFTSEGDLSNWIEISDIVVTINSTVGLEAILQGKPVITFGKSIYSKKGITIDTTVKKFKDDIKKAEKFDLSKSEVEKYYNFLYFNNTATIENFPMVLNELKKIEQKKYTLTKKSFYSYLQNKKYKYIYVCINLSNFHVNLTYRKNKYMIDKEYILNGINKYLKNFNIEYDDIIISTIKCNREFDKKDLYILITDMKEIKKEEHFQIFLNKYFMEFEV